MIDRELVNRKINLIAPDLSELEAVAARGLEAFLDDRINQVLVERYLERVIGRIIDINYHILTETGKPPPKDYYQSFTGLGGAVLPNEFARGIASAAGLRNRIVHDYDDIDPAKLFDGLASAVRDIPLYLKHIMDYISGLNTSTP